MKKVGIINPASGHMVRGVGFYYKNLIENLKSIKDEEIEIIVTDSDIQNNNYDLLHYPYFDLFSHSLPPIKKSKTVITIHDTIPLMYPNIHQYGILGKKNLILQKLALKNVDQIITDSYFSTRQLIDYLNIPHEKINIIYLAADKRFKKITDTQVLNQVKSTYSLPNEFVLYVGDINYSKNLPTLSLACNKIGLPLIIVGKQAADIAKLNLNHPELKHLKNLGSFKALGFVPDADLISIYNLATVYCQPSLAEGFGLPVLEAMSCGTPVICSTAPALCEIAGDSALYFDPINISELESILKYLFNDNKKRSELSKLGIKRSEIYSWENTAKQTLQVYKQIFNES